MPGVLGRSLAPCPVDGCDLDLAAASAEAAADPIRIRVDQTLADAIDEAARENAKARDAAIRAHLETHDVLDWLRTVRRLEQELYNAGPTGVRPHAYERLRDASKIDWPEPTSPQPVRLDVAGYEPGDTPTPPRVDG